MKTPICSFDAKTGSLCSKCESKLKTGHLSVGDVEASIKLTRLAEKNNILDKFTLVGAYKIEEKFNRLFIFYKEVLSRTGFDKYKTIDVRFAGQVIGSKSENPKVDSIQLRKNVEELLQQINKVSTE